MAMPDVLQEYIVNETITIKPSDWSSDKQYYIGLRSGTIQEQTKKNIILIQPQNSKLYLQYGIKAIEKQMFQNGLWLAICFSATTLPKEDIIIDYSVITDTNKHAAL